MNFRTQQKPADSARLVALGIATAVCLLLSILLGSGLWFFFGGQAPPPPVADMPAGTSEDDLPF